MCSPNDNNDCVPTVRNTQRKENRAWKIIITAKSAAMFIKRFVPSQSAVYN